MVDLMKDYLLFVGRWLFLGLALWGAWDLGSRAMVLVSPPVELSQETTPSAEVPPVPRPRADRPVKGVEVHYYAQLASFRSKAEAGRFVAKQSSSLGALEVRQVVIKSVTWYRVLAPRATAEAAQGTCDLVVSSGGDCLVLRF